MTVYDAITVGAGPAGSTAARILAQSGLHVLLLERAVFPRDKPCGGGVTHRARQLMPDGFADVVEQEVQEARFSYKHKPTFSRSSVEPLVYMTQRRHLDAFLAGRAVAAGATFRDGVRVTAVVPDGNVCRVETGTESCSARVVVGADGANGIVARSLGLQPAGGAWVALEGNSNDARRVAQWDRALGIDLGSVPGGYGWLFTKGDHVNVGAGGWRSSGPTLRAKLDEVCRHYGVRADSLCNLRGHTLPIRRRGAPLTAGNVMLAGDAAALVDPLSGEGIHSALLSGMLAARAASEYLESAASVTRYDAWIEGELGTELETSRQLQKLFHRSPRLYLSILKRSPRTWQKLVGFCRGDESYSSIKGSFGPLGAVATLAGRAIPDQRS